jgi:hypothetical protein
MVDHPAACCRRCGTAVLPLAQAKVTVQTKESLHLTASVPSADDERVRIERHHKPVLQGSGKQTVRKISKVYCRVCDNNLGNVQQLESKRGFQMPLWFLKTRKVGFRQCQSDDASVVRILPAAEGFYKFVKQEGTANAIRALPIKLPAEHCAHYKPDGVFELEGALAVAPEDEIDAVLDKLASARISNPAPPTPREHRKAVQDVTRAFLNPRPPRRRRPATGDYWQWAHEEAANQQANAFESMTRRGETLLR